MTLSSDARPRYVRVARAAEILRVDARTVLNWAKAGKLPHIRTIGGEHRYPEDALLRIAAAMERPAGEPEAREERTA